MYDSFSDGFCPECLLRDVQVPMRLNRMDLWECPVCHLQAHTAGFLFLAILRERGHGDLKSRLATDAVQGLMLTKAGTGSEELTADPCGFMGAEDLRKYLSSECGMSDSASKKPSASNKGAPRISRTLKKTRKAVAPHSLEKKINTKER